MFSEDDKMDYLKNTHVSIKVNSCPSSEGIFIHIILIDMLLRAKYGYISTSDKFFILS